MSDARSRDVAAQRAHRLRERADLNVDAPVQVEVIDRAASVLPEHTARMGIVDHHDAAEFFGQVAEPGNAPTSPSMLKTPSVMSNLRCEAGRSLRIWRAASTSLCGKTLMAALLSLAAVDDAGVVERI